MSISLAAFGSSREKAANEREKKEKSQEERSLAQGDGARQLVRPGQKRTQSWITVH